MAEADRKADISHIVSYLYRFSHFKAMAKNVGNPKAKKIQQYFFYFFHSILDKLYSYNTIIRAFSQLFSIGAP